MKRTPPKTLALPGHWTPQQALAVFEAIEALRDHLWHCYATDIQAAIRQDRQRPDPRQMHLPLDPDQPF